MWTKKGVLTSSAAAASSKPAQPKLTQKKPPKKEKKRGKRSGRRPRAKEAHKAELRKLSRVPQGGLEDAHPELVKRLLRRGVWFSGKVLECQAKVENDDGEYGAERVLGTRGRIFMNAVPYTVFFSWYDERRCFPGSLVTSLLGTGRDGKPRAKWVHCQYN